jgi:hypothetical protein
MPKVRFAIDEASGAAAAMRKVERASETMGEVERTEAWATIKHYTAPTAQKSLHLAAQRANAHLLVEHTGVTTWTAAICSNLPSPKSIFALITDSSNRPVAKWLQGFSKFTHLVAERLELTLCLAAAGHAERAEKDWEDAVKRAHATHAFHEHMVCWPVHSFAQG